MNSIEPLPGDPVSAISAEAVDARLAALHSWAREQQFQPPRWIRHPDLQTSWYVIREIAAGLKERRIGARQIWEYVSGQEKNYAAAPAGGPAGPPQSSAASAGNRAVAALPGFYSESVELPFDTGGFLNGVLDSAGPSRKVAILLHGLEGSAEATYMRGTARRLLERGISAVRVNMVNCGGSEGATRRFYHAGFTLMVEISVQWALRRGFERIVVVGFSLGGNLVLKYLGGSNLSRPPAVAGGVAVSTPMDLARSVRCIDRPRNKFYRYRFLKSMLRTMKRKQELFPDLLPQELEWVDTIAEFDHRYTAPANGFSSGSQYYAQSSSFGSLAGIDRPTLILQAQDDIYIPFESFQEFDWNRYPNLIPLFPRHGSHLGFHASARDNWMEKVVAEYCDRLLRLHKVSHPFEQ